MPSNTIQPNSPGLDKGIAAGQRLVASKSIFVASLSTGATIATLVDPFGAGSTFAVVGTPSPQLALSSGAIVKGSTAAVVGSEYNIRVMATSADGMRETSAILTFGAVLEFGGLSGIGGGVSITSASTVSVAENASLTLPLTASIPGVTWAKTGGADASLFTLTGSTLTLAAKDFEDSHGPAYVVQITATVTATGLTVTQTITATVTNVLEGVLAPTTAAFPVGSAAGTLIATVTGLDIGANETLASISPNDGRLALASGATIRVGLSASAAGIINATVTTSAGRTLAIAITAQAVFTNASERLAAPAGLGYTPPFNITRSFAGVSHDFDPVANKPVAANTIFVRDAGVDTANGLTEATAVRRIPAAITKANTLGGVVAFNIEPRLRRSSDLDGWNGTPITCSPVIESSVPGSRVISLADVILPTDVATATDARVYVSTYTTETPAPAMLDISQLDEGGIYMPLQRSFPADNTEATIVAAINARITALAAAGAAAKYAGAFYLDTVNKKRYFRAYPDRAPDTNIVTIKSVTSNLNVQPAAGQTRSVYTSPDIVVLGGNTAFRMTSNPTGAINAVLNRGVFGHSGTSAGVGMSAGPGAIYLVGTEACYTAQDGFNYNNTGGAGLIAFHELHTRAYGTGISSDGDGSNNSSSAGALCTGVRVSCDYSDNSNRALQELTSGKSWSIDTKLRAPRFGGNGQLWDAAICCGIAGTAGTPMMWVDNATIDSAYSYKLQAYDGGQLFTANMDTTGFVNNVSGTGASIGTYVSGIVDIVQAGDAIVLDPASGKTLAANWSEAVDGKQLILMPGNHGDPTITRANTIGVEVIGMPGAIIGQTKLTGAAAKWTFRRCKFRKLSNGAATGVTATGAAVAGVYANETDCDLISALGTTSNIILDGCDISTADDDVAASWTDAQWISQPWHILVHLFSQNSHVRNCRIRNGRRMVALDTQGAGTADNSTVINNFIEHFGADGVDFHASNIRLNYNLVQNCRHTDNEPLHSDAFQGYGDDSSATIYSNIETIGNRCYEGEYTDGSLLKLNFMQCISSFDGRWRNWTIRDNKGTSNANHAISTYGVDGVDCCRNEMLKQNNKNANQAWIAATLSKTNSGRRAPKRVRVCGNVCADIWIYLTGVYAWPAFVSNAIQEGSGYTPANTSVAFNPTGPTATLNIRTGTTGGIAAVNMVNRAIDVFDPASPPAITLTGDGNGAQLLTGVLPTSAFKDELGIWQVQRNRKPDGSLWASNPPPMKNVV